MYNYLDNALIVGLGGEVGEDPGRLEDGGGVVTCNSDDDNDDDNDDANNYDDDDLGPGS